MSAGQAVVVGGGVGGLLAAAVLARQRDRVTIVERDRLPDRPGPRRGVPQGRCLHMLMGGGLAAFERLLPGFGADLAAAGARPFDFGERSALRFPHGWLPRFRAGITAHACSRGLLEHVLRARVLRDERIRVIEGVVAEGLAGDARRVTGVQLRGTADTIVDAELVVVADGSGTALPGWLAAIGVAPPDEIVVESGVHYTSCWFAIPEGFRDDWKFLAVAPEAGGPPRSGAVFEAEERRWGVVLLGPRDDPAPADHADFLRAAAGLADRRIFDAIAAARPIGPVAHYGRSRSRLHRCDSALQWPEGLVALGDAVCALDPYYGLGMTACARGVEVLAQGTDDGARRFQERLGEANDEPWRIVTGRDRDGRPDARDAFALGCLHRLAPRSIPLARVLIERMHLCAPDGALSSPDVARLVRAALESVTMGGPPRERGSPPKPPVETP